MNPRLYPPSQVTGADPAANAEIAETVPDGELWLLCAVTVLLVQGATQTPRPILVIKDADGDVAFESFGASAAQSASTTARYTWAPNLELSALVGTTPDIHANAPLPSGLYLPEGWQITTTTLGKGAATNYGAPSLYVVKF